MIYLFKLNGERYVYDEGSNTLSQLTMLQYKMISYVKPPLSEDLPTSLRYDLAKYDGGAVSDAYEGIYALFEAGKLYTDFENDGGVYFAECKDGEMYEKLRTLVNENL